MSVQMVLLPVFVQAGLTFFLLLWAARGRGNGASRSDNRFADQFELPVLFYALIAIALPLRRVDLVLVMLSWVFVVTRFAHAGILAASKDTRTRSLAWLAGTIVLLAMWGYFALKMLFPL